MANELRRKSKTYDLSSYIFLCNSISEIVNWQWQHSENSAMCDTCCFAITKVHVLGKFIDIKSI